MLVRRILGCSAFALGLVMIPACGDALAPTNFEVKITMGGAPVDGAVVTLMPAGKDGTSTNLKPGQSDNAGVAKLAAPKGEYKVIVRKEEAVGGTMSMDPGKNQGKDLTKDMAKMMGKNMAKAGPPAMGGAGGGANKGPKSLLPEQYGSYDKTPLKITVPPADKETTFDLGK